MEQEPQGMPIHFQLGIVYMDSNVSECCPLLCLALKPNTVSQLCGRPVYVHTLQHSRSILYSLCTAVYLFVYKYVKH